MNQSLSLLHHQDHDTAAAASGLPELHSITDRGQKSSNNSGSHSMDESSSTEEALSRRSNSPTASAPGLENSNHHRYNQPDHVDNMNMHGTVVESSCGRIAYLSSAQMNEANMASCPLSAFPDDNSIQSGSPLQALPSASGSGSEFYFRSSSDFEKACKEFRTNSPILSRPRQLSPASRTVLQPRTDCTRWLQASRISALPPDHQEYLNALPLSRFGSEVQNQLSHNEVSYMQGHAADASSSRPQPSSKLDIRINLGFNQPGSLQESTFGYRSFSGPLTTSSTVPTGATGSILDITAQHALSGYTTGQYSTSIGPNNVSLSSFNTALAGTPTGMRLHEYEVPSPRMVLWDFQE